MISPRPVATPLTSIGAADLGRESAWSARLSLNHKTLEHCPLPELVPLLAERGIRWMGLWIDAVEELGEERTARLLADHGVAVSSLCRAGFVTGDESGGLSAANRRAVDLAAALGAECLVVVVGGLPPGSTSLPRARDNARRGFDAIVAAASAAGVPVALEPMHPLFAADRGVLSTLGQSLTWVESHSPSAAGLALDSFHVWWDPDLDDLLARAAGRLLGVQLADWATPLTVGETVERAMPGDGHIDLAGFCRRIDGLGYRGPVEVELFNRGWAGREPGGVLDVVAQRHAALDPGVSR